ncbi:UBA/TS-N domain containing hypothetical protein [Phytophthora palmivora]|uniref:Uncharacterized protein n=1 Tax=Phytophthora palmivora TaxID=4796 RepID=A0A2P4X454_9STRA|nr:UBA/TS-N domain containing hypothetical protein [Phytophthora palmivora]
MKLMEYRYHIEHIEGPNIWAGNQVNTVALRAMALRKRGRREENRTPHSESERRREEEERTQSKRRRGEEERTHRLGVEQYTHW